MDRAIRAEWYDLDEADREPFLGWCHGEYCPRLQAIPGHIWVGHYRRVLRPPEAPRRPVTYTDDPSVPTGSQYLLVIAAATPDVFFDPNRPEADDPVSTAWLARRKGYRSAIFVEESRVNGPDWYRHLQGHAAPPALQLGNFRTRSEADDLDISLWYRQKRFPQITRARGCIGVRKLVSVVGWPKHGILYEFSGMDPDEFNFERRFREAIFDPPLVGRDAPEVSIHAPHGPLAGPRIWPPL